MLCFLRDHKIIIIIMNIEAKIVKTLKKMPLSLQQELLHYAEYLETKYIQDNSISDNNSELIEDFSQAWQEAMTGQTIPVSELWEKDE
jgi:Protein of unknown function (DUF2281)